MKRQYDEETKKQNIKHKCIVKSMPEVTSGKFISHIREDEEISEVGKKSALNTLPYKCLYMNKLFLKNNGHYVSGRYQKTYYNNHRDEEYAFKSLLF